MKRKGGIRREKKLKWKWTHNLWDVFKSQNQASYPGEAAFHLPSWHKPFETSEALTFHYCWTQPPASPLTPASQLRHEEDALGPDAIAWDFCCFHFKTGQIVKSESFKKRFFFSLRASIFFFSERCNTSKQRRDAIMQGMISKTLMKRLK